jgi:acyl carrier protein
MKTTILLLLISTICIGQSYNWDSIALETQKKLDRNESIVDSISRMEVMNAIKKENNN